MLILFIGLLVILVLEGYMRTLVILFLLMVYILFALSVAYADNSCRTSCYTIDGITTCHTTCRGEE